jgi:hypothetical protein
MMEGMSIERFRVSRLCCQAAAVNQVVGVDFHWPPHRMRPAVVEAEFIITQ